MGSLLLQKLKEKANNPDTKDKIFLGVMPKELSYWQADSSTEKNKFDCINGSITYKKFLELVEIKKEHIQELNRKYNPYTLSFEPIFVYRKVHLDTIATFIASMELNLTPVLIFDERYREVRSSDSELNKYLCSLNKELNFDADFYIASSGTTNGKPKLLPCYEKDLIKQVENNCKMGLDNFTVYSTLSMTGITGVALNAFLPIIGNCKTIINDKYNLFENISDTKADAFFLPFNYRDFLPLEKGNYNFSHVKCIILSGGYFNYNDIGYLLSNLPGLKPEVFIHMYSATEFNGVSAFCGFKDLNPVFLNIGELLKGNISFCNPRDNLSMQYMSVGKANKFQILDENGNVLEEDQMGFISRNGVSVSDLGFIHNGYLYVLGRNQDSELNTNILENYFKFKINREVAIGTYDGQMIPFVGIVGDGFSAYKDTRYEVIRKPITKEDIANQKAIDKSGLIDKEVGINETLEYRKPRYIGKNYLDNLQARDAANRVIKVLEDELDLEFYGDAILTRFETNKRLEKKVFSGKTFNPFDTSDTINGEDLFDKYYYIIKNLEEYTYMLLIERLNSNNKSIGKAKPYLEVLFKLRDFLNKLLLNDNLLEEISHNPKVKDFFETIFVLPMWTNIDFQDIHCLDSINKNVSCEEFRKTIPCDIELSNDLRTLVRIITAQIYEFKSKIGLNIGEERINYGKSITFGAKIMKSFGNNTLMDYLESLMNEYNNSEDKNKSFVKSIDRIIK